MHAVALPQLAESSTRFTPLLFWIPGLPLAAFTVLIFFGRRLGRLSAWIAVAALASSCALTLSLASAVVHGQRFAADWAWLSLPVASGAGQAGSADPMWSVGFSLDGLSWIMLFVVTSIGTMIQLYSIGYMRHDPRFSRFFAYLSLFCASMLGLVLADHFVLLYACWELVGLCSYLLISFWCEKPAAAAAGRKAFLTTRIGDTGLFLGILLLAWTSGTLHFSKLVWVRETLLDSHPGLLTIISLLVFFGAVGKSAQIPLHVWLPDAMEGPTSVSALIHAATMVAAGVYLVARTFPLFTPQSLSWVLTIGLSTHLLAGTVALTMTDIKRVLAYSTVSQLGLMMTALGLGAVPAAMFHLFTHAFFKALLFLAAGSIIHAAHAQDLARLGGLAASMPWTRRLFLIASLSMSGCVFLSGFWSKDAILLAAEQAHPALLWVLVLGATMTTAYIFRLYFRCFHGVAAGHGHAAPHESPAIMVGPMAALGVGAALVGLAGSPWLGHPFFHLLGDSAMHEGIDLPILAVSMAALAVGLWLAWTIGFKRRNLLPVPLRPLGVVLYTLAANKYYVDEFYSRAMIRPLLSAAGGLARFDRVVIDGAVNASGALGQALGEAKRWFDQTVVDGAVNATARTVQGLGAVLRRTQTGVVQEYLWAVVAAVVMLAIVLQ